MEPQNHRADLAPWSKQSGSCFHLFVEMALSKVPWGHTTAISRHSSSLFICFLTYLTPFSWKRSPSWVLPFKCLLQPLLIQPLATAVPCQKEKEHSTSKGAQSFIPPPYFSLTSVLRFIISQYSQYWHQDFPSLEFNLPLSFIEHILWFHQDFNKSLWLVSQSVSPARSFSWIWCLSKILELSLSEQILLAAHIQQVLPGSVLLSPPLPYSCHSVVNSICPFLQISYHSSHPKIHLIYSQYPQIPPLAPPPESYNVYLLHGIV